MRGKHHLLPHARISTGIQPAAWVSSPGRFGARDGGPTTELTARARSYCLPLPVSFLAIPSTSFTNCNFNPVSANYQLIYLGQVLESLKDTSSNYLVELCHDQRHHEVKVISSPKHLLYNVHSSTVSQNLETTQCPLREYQYACSLEIYIAVRIKNNIDESYKHKVEQIKPRANVFQLYKEENLTKLSYG